VAEEAVARYVRGRGWYDLAHRVAGCLVQEGGRLDSLLDLLLRDDVSFERRGEDAKAERFREDQSVTGLCSDVTHDPIFLDEARHGEAVLRLLILDGVAAAELRSCFFDLRLAPGQDLTQYSEVQRAWEGDEVHRGQGLAAHRVHVRERVGRGDLAEAVWVVHDGREEVRRLQEQAAAERDEPRVVAGLQPAHEAVNRLGRESLQCLLQVPWSELGSSTSLRRVLRQPYARTLVHHSR
jgi:hypothetical protein